MTATGSTSAARARTAAGRGGALGVGVLGVGRIGRVHASTLARSIANARLVGVADSLGDRAVAVAEEFGVRVWRSVEELLDDEEVDAVVVASPTPTHARYTVMAAEREKHVLCEKPLALDEATAADAAATAQRAGVVLQLGLMLRFDADVVRLRDAIAVGKLGDIEIFHASLRDMAPPSAAYLSDCGGLMSDAAVHLLDLATWLVGPVESVSAQGARMRSGIDSGGVDLALTTLRFASGALGMLENARGASYGAECRVEVVGSQGSAKIERARSGNLEWRTPGAATVDLVADFLEPFAAAYRSEVGAFVDAALAIGPCRAGSDVAVAATRLSAAAATALEAGTVVQLDRVAAT
jgi:predicted dehydrogenase